MTATDTHREAERWQRLRSIFDAVADAPSGARASLVADLCANDDSLQADVQQLLSVEHRMSDSFLDLPVVRAALTDADQARDDETVAASTSPVGQRISHYEVDALIGAGGMGQVYRARDVALGRAAALKMLPACFPPSLQMRLREEAEACAHLQHPNIATYFESGSSDAGAFIAMELVEGETLRSALRDGPLTIDQAVGVARCLLEALSHAHSVGILHRDIKPENVMITGPASAKLLDFGLAKHFVPGVQAGVLPDAVSVVGVVGTVGYMSPEQIENAGLDERSDLFQVGAVLYEALTGKPAFPGDTIVQRLSAVLVRDVDPLPPTIPASLAAIVRRAVERNPDRRYPTAAALLRDLHALPTPNVVNRARAASLAILDFSNATPEHSPMWISSGVADALSSEFARIKGLRVIPRERIQAASQESEQTAARLSVLIGRRVSCRWVLEGTYARCDDGLRFDVSLVEAATETVVREFTLCAPVAALLDVQSRIVTRVLEAIAISRDAKASARPAPSLSAYELYARGRRLFLRLEKGSLEEARACYEQAIEDEPSYAAALSGLAGFHAMRFTFTTDPRTLDLAADFARRAVDADEHSADARNWLGYALFRRGHLEAAAHEFARARELQSEWFFPYYFGGAVARVRGDIDGAIGLSQLAAVLEPRQSFPMLALACMQTEAGHYDEACWCFERAAAIEQSHSGAAQWPGLSGFHAECLRRMGRLELARPLCVSAIEDVERSDHMYRDSNRVVCLVTLGRIALDQHDRDAARAAFRQALAHLQGREHTLAGGWLAVQSMAGLARADNDLQQYTEAVSLNEKRDRFDFSWLYFCWDDVTWRDLSLAADALSLDREAETMRARAVSAGLPQARVD